MHSDLSPTLVLAACALVRTRFFGRADLQRAAERDPIALATLAQRLEIIDEMQAATLRDAEMLRRIRLVSDRIPAEIVADLEAGGWRRARVLASHYRAGHSALVHVRDVDRWHPELAAKIAARRALASLVDPLENREAWYAANVVAAKRARKLAKKAFRTAMHSHHLVIRCCEKGVENATSESNSVRPSDVGLCNAYSQKGFWVATSEHHLAVSRAILLPATKALQAKAPHGIVYLSARVRVRQGRGTSLICERSKGPRGGWVRA